MLQRDRIIRDSSRCMSQPSSRPAGAASGSAAPSRSSCCRSAAAPILERSVDGVRVAPVGRRGDRRAAAGARRRSAGVSALGRAFARHATAKPLRGRRPAARGGRTRWRTRSARRRATTDVIVIHDAARPFASADLIARTIAAAAESGAALAAVQARDTVKRADRVRGRRPAGPCSKRSPRETIFLAQTPQAFRREVLRRALELGARDRRRRPTRRRWPSAPASRSASSRARRRTSRSRRRRIWPLAEAIAAREAAIAVRSRSRSRRGPGAPAPATTCIGWSPAGRWSSAASRFRPSAARSATPTPTSSATR